MILQVAASFYSPTNSMWVLISLHPGQYCCYLFIPAVLVCLKRYLIIYNRLSWYVEEFHLQSWEAFFLSLTLCNYIIFSTCSASLAFSLAVLWSYQLLAPPYMSGPRDASYERFQWSQDADTYNWAVHGWSPPHTLEAARNKHDRQVQAALGWAW